MNASLWQLAGWTMIHSLWIGGAVALAGGFLRLAARRAAPNTRYAISLATLAALAASPLAATAWLSINGVPQLAPVALSSVLPPPPGGSNEHDRQWRSSAGGSPLRSDWGGGMPAVSGSRLVSPIGDNQDIIQAAPPLLHPSLTLPLEGREPEVQIQSAAAAARSSAPLVIDLAHVDPSPRYSGERLGEGQNLLTATPSPAAEILPNATVGNPSPSPSLPGRGTTLPASHQSPITRHLASLIPYLPALWLVGAPLTFTLLAAGLVGSARLRRRATPLVAGPAFDACERMRSALRVTRRVALAACDGVAQPVLVGVFRPLILLPTAALAGWTPEQLDMILLHELAHVRRWDNLVNLLQRIVESLLFYHPAVWILSRQVRHDREECCDAAVIRHTARPEAYATLLIDIASRLRLSAPQSLAVASTLASHPLAGRIRRILNIEAEPMRITRRTLAATLLLPAILAGAIFYSGASAQDGNSPPLKEQPSTVASGERAQGGSVNAGGIPDANQSDTLASDNQARDGSAIEERTPADSNISTDANTPNASQPNAPTSQEPAPADDLAAEIARLEPLVQQHKKDFVERDVLAMILSNDSLSAQLIEQTIKESVHRAPDVESATKRLRETQNHLAHLTHPSAPLDETKIRRLQQLRGQLTQEVIDAEENYIKQQQAVYDSIPRDRLHQGLRERLARIEKSLEQSEEHATDLALAKRMAGARKTASQSANSQQSSNQSEKPTVSSANSVPPKQTATEPPQSSQPSNNSAGNALSTAIAELEQRRQSLVAAEAALSNPPTLSQDALIEKYVAISLQNDSAYAAIKQQGGAILNARKQLTSSGATSDDATIQQLSASFDQIKQELNAYRESTRADVAKRVAAGEQPLVNDILSIVAERELIRAKSNTLQAKREFDDAQNRLVQLANSTLPREPKATASPAASGSADAPPANPNTSQLQEEIRNLEAIIAKVQQDRTDLEVFKELARQGAASPALIEKAIAQELEADQTLKAHNDRLQNIDRLIASEELLLTNKSLDQDRETIEKLNEIRKTTTAKRDAYQAEATEKLRERFSKTRKEELHAAATEYKIRSKTIEENLAKYQQELDAALKKLSQLGVDSANAPRSDVHLPTLQSEIRNLEALVAKAQEEVVNLEVFKQMGGHGRYPGPSELDQAIAKEVEQDPTANELRQKLFEQQTQLQTQLAESKNANSAAIQKLRSAVQLTEAEQAKHAQQLEKSLRKKLAHIPAEAKAKAEADYNARYQAAQATLAKHQQDLAAARAKLLNADNAPTGGPGSPNQGGAATRNPAADAQPTTNASSGSAAPVQKPEPPANPFSEAKLQKAFKSGPDNPALTVDYAFDQLPPQQYEDQWKDLFDGLQKDPYGPRFAFEHETAADQKHMRITAPVQAHRAFFEPFFSGEFLKAELAAAAAKPGPAVPTKEIIIDFPDGLSEDDHERIRQELRVDGLGAMVTTRKPKAASSAAGKTTKPIPCLHVLVPKTWQAKPVWETRSTGELTLRIVNEAELTDAVSSASPGDAAAGSHPTAPDALREEIRDLEGLVARAQKESDLSKEITLEIMKDPAVTELQTKLWTEQARLKLHSRLAEAKSPKFRETQQLRSDVQRMESEFVQHLHHLEKSVREKLSSPANKESASRSTADYRARSRAANEQLAEYQRELAAVKAKLAEHASSEAGAAAPVPAPTPTPPANSPLAPQAASSPASNAWNNDSPSNPLAAPGSNTWAEAAAQPAAGAAPAAITPLIVPQSGNQPAHESSGWNTAPPSAANPQLAKLQPLTAPDFAAHFVVGPDNHLSEFSYTVHPDIQQAVRERLDAALDVLRANGSDPPPKFYVNWRGADILSIIAAERAQHFLLVDPTTGRPLGGVDRLGRSYTSPVSHFPTLENQQVADRAYKLLGLELEPVNPRDLERARKLGYEGALQVVAVDSQRHGHGGFWKPGVLLAGLHAWPTTDMKSLDAILTRDDLDTLSPLKYRAIVASSTEETMGDEKPVMEDRVVSLRIPIDFDRFQEIQDELQAKAERVQPTANDEPFGGDDAPTGGPGSPNQGGAATRSLPAAEAGDLGHYSNNIASPPHTAAALKPGDSVVLKVVGAFPEQPLDGLFRVEPEGTLALGPTYGRVAVVGKTALEAEAAVQAHLSTILSEAKTQLTIGESPQPASSDETTFLYDGKTFAEWRDLWKHELKTERRIEAINALAAFARTGYAQEATDAILAVAAEYPENAPNSSPEARLLEAVEQAVARIPAKHWMPQLQERIAAAAEADKKPWINLAWRLLRTTQDHSEPARQLAVKFAQIPNDYLLGVTALYLYRGDPELSQPITTETIRRALRLNPPGIDIAYIGFRHVEKIPELVDVFVRDPRVRQQLRGSSSPVENLAVLEMQKPLLAILRSPDRAQDHLGALRALKTIAPGFRHSELAETRRKIAEELIAMLPNTPPELLPATLATLTYYMGDGAVAQLDGAVAQLAKRGDIPAEILSQLEGIDQTRLLEELNAH